MVELKLQEKLTEKEQKTFKLMNTLRLQKFNGVQTAICLGGVYKDNTGNWQYNPEFSMAYINTNVTPNKLISFCELHKNIILKEKLYIDRHFLTVYYILYVREEKPMIVNDFYSFSANNVDVEVIFNDNGYYRFEELHLALSSNTSIIGAIYELFSNENIKGLPFITQDDNGIFFITYYDEYGRTKQYRYETLQSIFNCITNIRLVGCEKQEME